MSESKSPPKRVFTEEFKREAVRLAIERGNVCGTARDLGIHETVLGRWKRAVEKEAPAPSASPVSSVLSARSDDRPLATFPGKGNPRDEEIVKLQRENARLREENEILKKAVGIFSKAPR
jgi:transposase